MKTTRVKRFERLQRQVVGPECNRYKAQMTRAVQCTPTSGHVFCSCTFLCYRVIL